MYTAALAILLHITAQTPTTQRALLSARRQLSQGLS